MLDIMMLMIMILGIIRYDIRGITRFKTGSKSMRMEEKVKTFENILNSFTVILYNMYCRVLILT